MTSRGWVGGATGSFMSHLPGWLWRPQNVFIRWDEKGSVFLRMMSGKSTLIAIVFVGSASAGTLRTPLLSLRGGASSTDQKTLPKAIEKALATDDLIKVRGAIESGMVDPSTCLTATGNAMLHVAANQGSLRCIEYMLADDRSPVDLERFDGVTAAMFAAQSGHRLCLAVLLRRGADVNAVNHDGSTPIHFSARQGHADCINLLQSNGAKLDAKRADGITPLMCAAQSAQPECLQLLLSHGADATLTDNLGASALHFASRQGDSECIAALLKCKAAAKLGAKYTNVQDKVGTAPLHLAADNGHSHCVAALLQGGAAADRKRQDGSTPTHYACINGHSECARLLLAAGADINARRADGATAAHFAAQMGHADCMQLLLLSGADVNAQLPGGSTPLDLASATAQGGGGRRSKPSAGQLKCIALLERAGAESSR